MTDTNMTAGVAERACIAPAWTQDGERAWRALPGCSLTIDQQACADGTLYAVQAYDPGTDEWVTILARDSLIGASVCMAALSLGEPVPIAPEGQDWDRLNIIGEQAIEDIENERERNGRAGPEGGTWR
jgi:hypothetical protein